MPSEFDEAALQDGLSRLLASSQDSEPAVIWVKEGDEVVVWLDSLSVALEPGMVRVRVDLESDQTGRAAQDVVIALAEPSSPPSLLAVSDETARGDARLAARWGRALQDAVWAGLLELAGEDAAGIAAGDGSLVVHPRAGA